MSRDFTEEQKRYLEGFGRGLGIARASGSKAEAQFIGPDKIHRDAQDRVLAAGGKLVREEEAKRAKHPFDMWDEIAANAAKGEFPKGTDVFLYKFHGLFYVAPAQDSFMCRLRNPNGIIDSHKLRAVAAIAEEFGGGYTHITTRANLQIREIAPKSTLAVLERIAEAGLTSRGAGADNVRNITSNPTAGVDPQELYDTRPLGVALYHAILNHRELYGLPRKFNVAFDGGGRVASLEDTNDIGFTAVRVAEGKGVPAGIHFRVAVGGITGHGDFAGDLGVLITPQQCLPVAVAIVRVFIDEGDRTDRKRARLKYVLDRLGRERFLVAVEARLPAPLTRFALAEIGLAAEASAVRAGLVACTGNTGCKFSATDTKRHAVAIADHLDAKLKLEAPLNIHLTGCPNSCAQHYIGDIGLLGARIADGESEIEGYHLYIGGGYGERRELAREILRDVPAPEVPHALERLLHAYRAQRASPGETFQAFARRHSPEALRALAQPRLPEAA